MSKRKAHLGLQGLTERTENPKEEATPSVQATPTTNEPKAKKKINVPLYIDPLLHDALHVLAFSERHKKTTFQTLFFDGLDLLLEKRGLPSVAELSSGEKTINL
jgi:hypothetical protein